MTSSDTSGGHARDRSTNDPEELGGTSSRAGMGGLGSTGDPGGQATSEATAVPECSACTALLVTVLVAACGWLALDRRQDRSVLADRGRPEHQHPPAHVIGHRLGVGQ